MKRKQLIKLRIAAGPASAELKEYSAKEILAEIKRREHAANTAAKVLIEQDEEPISPNQQENE